MFHIYVEKNIYRIQDNFKEESKIDEIFPPDNELYNKATVIKAVLC